MAKNTNKRIPVKWVRDRAKSAYTKQDRCWVCGSQSDLELHHLHSITVLLERWAKHCGYDISTDQGILAVRDEFIEQHHSEIYEQVYTLCNHHHVQLHGVYGKTPQPGSEPKQARWLQIQRDKSNGTELPKQSYGSPFSEFV